jgi:iron(III) transport system substrate-binding protein
MKRRALLASLAAGAVGSAFPQEILRFPAKGRVPAGYPASYAATIAAAEQEGRLTIHSTTDIEIAAPLIDDFQALYPLIEVRYLDLNSNDLHNGYLGELLTSPTTADVLWSSAMDAQFRIAQAGQVMAYASPERASLPAWAVWGDRAFGTTFEPIAIMYDKRALAADEVPTTHAELARLLVEGRARFSGKVVTYDVERSGLGYLLATQDEGASGQWAALVAALGAVGARLVAQTDAMLKRVSSGEAVIAYNALGSYAEIVARKTPSIGIAYARDYTLVVTRVMVIGQKAASPNAAKLWVDYVLSMRGQSILGQRVNLAPLRADASAAKSAASLATGLGASARPIALDAGTLGAASDPARRVAFLRQWQQAFSGGNR